MVNDQSNLKLSLSKSFI